MRAVWTVCALTLVVASCGDGESLAGTDDAIRGCRGAQCPPASSADENQGTTHDGKQDGFPSSGECTCADIENRGDDRGSANPSDCTGSENASDDADSDAGVDAPEDDGATDDPGSDAGGDDDPVDDGGTDDPGPDVPDDDDSGQPGDDTDDQGPVSMVKLPPINGSLDYQLGGAYTPPEGVNVVSRDRTASIVPGIYNICYINGFQVQPGEENLWPYDLILRDANGNPVIDPDWDEALLDTRTADKRARIAEIVGAWIDDCAKKGYDAIEIDNLDTFTRSSGRLKADDAVALMALFSARAHAVGLASAQKNTVELLKRRHELGTDFVVSEACARYNECQEYVSAYGSAVLMIEYRSQDFEKGCRQFGASHAIVLRDVALVPAGKRGYVYQGC